jgi:hypothetical protein
MSNETIQQKQIPLKQTLAFLGGIGSDRPKNGNAKLTKLLL